ncbi:MAG: LysR family transcriptional regulator [Christensenellaceae bacterium]|nr:LysR family transcriptional regulator [Christensenellaceae bacterium]
MAFSLDHYRIFHAVVQHKSFSAAAAQLYVTQPAVSQAVKQMEQDFGTRLFIRTKNGILLTEEGEILSGYIASALGLIDAGEQRVKKIAQLSAGVLRIGASDTISRWFLTPFLEEFHTLYPDIAITMTNRTSSEILKLLSAGQVDIGYVNLPITARGMRTVACKTVHDGFIAGPRYAGLAGKRLSLQDVAAHPMIMLERAANSRRYVDKFFLSAGIELEAQIELSAHDLIADYVRIGLGVGCVTREFCPEAAAGGDLFFLELDRPVPPRQIGACYPEGIEISAAARKFIDMTQQPQERG